MIKLIPPALLLAITACEPMVSHRGHVQHEAMLENVRPGMSSTQLLRQFGSPSSQSALGGKTWYYIQSRKEAQAFLEPKITDQEVIAIHFDASGMVESIEQYGLDDRREIVMVEDVTPTEGHSISFLEQVLGNLGRFNNTGGRDIDPRGPAGRR